MNKILIFFCFLLLITPLYSQEDEIELFEDPEEEIEIFEDEDAGEEELLGDMEGLDESGEEEFDFFDDTDSSILDESPEKFDLIKRLLENISAKSESRYYYFFNKLDVEENANPEPDKQQHMFEQHSLYSTKASGDIWQFNLGITTDIGNQEYTYKSQFHKLDKRNWEDWFQDTDNERRYFDIDECYLSLYLSSLSLFIGKKIFVNTLSSLYTPADNYIATDLNDPLDGKKFGKYQIQGDISIGNGTLSLIFFPVYQGGKTVSPLSRWGYYKAKKKQEEDNITIEDPEEEESGERNYEDITPENFSYFTRYKSTLGGVDFFGSLFYGLAGNTVTKQVDGGDKEMDVIPVFNAAIAFATVADKFEFHGEALYNYSIASRDDDYIRYVAGLRYTLDGLREFIPLDKIELVGEYAGEYIFKRQSAADYVDSTEDFRGLKNDLLALIYIEISDKLNLNIFGQYEFIDKGAAFSAHLEYQWLENVALDLGGEFFHYPESSNYYFWRDNHRVLFKITYDY